MTENTEAQVHFRTCNARNSSLKKDTSVEIHADKNEMKHTSVKHFKILLKLIPHPLYANLWFWTSHQADSLILCKALTCIWFLNNCNQKAIISGWIKQVKSKKHVSFAFVHCSCCIIKQTTTDERVKIFVPQCLRNPWPVRDVFPYRVEAVHNVFLGIMKHHLVWILLAPKINSLQKFRISPPNLSTHFHFFYTFKLNFV